MDTEVLGQSKVIEIPYDTYWQIVVDSLSEKKKIEIQDLYGGFEYWLDTDQAFKYSNLVDYKIGIVYSKDLADSMTREDDEPKTIIFKIINFKKLVKFRLKYGF
jgi:hypothetical protein